MAKNNQPAQQREGFGGYIKGVRKEMSKVVWPTRKELGAYTLVVLATCAVSAILFLGVDTGVIAILKNVLHISMN